ncbi:cytochrome oxidase assembly factor [Pisolithus marmoratus]|nr:cytochrome oxidase assembly factor [Pisolithus marmoratus]
MYTSAVILGVGVTYAAVPLYRMFCSATGFAGTPTVLSTSLRSLRSISIDAGHRCAAASASIFNADRAEALPWKFFPQQKYVDVLPGESSLAFYKARNREQEGRHRYCNVAPYFSKVECFCFEEAETPRWRGCRYAYTFLHRQDILDDPSCRGINDVVLSYTFFKARRNARGHLEPDADEDVVQRSLGPRAETRKAEGSEATKTSPNFPRT